MTLGNTVDGDTPGTRSLNISAVGNGSTVTLGDAVGAFNRLSSFDITGTTISFNGPTVNTTGNQSYAGALTLGANTTLSAANLQTVSGSVFEGAGKSLSIVANASLDGVINNVSQFSVSGSTNLSGNVTSTGNQTYAGNVVLKGNSVLWASGANAIITSSADLNSDSATSTAALTLNASGANGSVVLNGAIGSTLALSLIHI